MKNLIEKIEKRKPQSYHTGYDEGYHEAVDDIVDLLKQHNIIVAPKSIKLSEIIVRLKNEFSEHFFFYNKIEKRIEVGSLSYWLANIYIKNNKIDLRDKDRFDYPNWLYTLWIVGTEIIDDMEE